MKSEIITRRAFFKKAAKKTLPILIGASMLSSFVSCDKEDDELLEAFVPEEFKEELAEKYDISLDGKYKGR